MIHVKNKYWIPHLFMIDISLLDVDMWSKLAFVWYFLNSYSSSYYNLITNINKLTLSKERDFFFLSKMHHHRKQKQLIKLFSLSLSISNTQPQGFYYTFIRDNDFPDLREPYVSAISRKMLSTTQTNSWCVLKVLSVHINSANSDISYKMSVWLDLVVWR